MTGTKTTARTASVTAIAFGPTYSPLYFGTGTMSIPKGAQFHFTFSAGTTCTQIGYTGTFVQLGSTGTAQVEEVRRVREAMTQP